MATDPTGYAGPHPDLRPLFCGALELMNEQADGHTGGSPGPPGMQPDDLTVRCQRTWRDIDVPGSSIDGSDFSAGIIQFAANRKHYSYFVEAARQPGSPEWSWAGMSGGERSRSARDRAGGFMLAGGANACIGEMRQPSGRFAALLQRIFRKRSVAQIQVEHADETRYSAGFGDDGACIVFAPVVKSIAYDDQVVVRRLDATGNVVSEDRVWIGDGGPPPPEILNQLTGPQ